MIDKATRSVNILSDLIRTGALVLIGFIFLAVGSVLATGSRPEAVLPLLLGAAAIFQLPKRIWNHYRDLTGNY